MSNKFSKKVKTVKKVKKVEMTQITRVWVHTCICYITFYNFNIALICLGDIFLVSESESSESATFVESPILVASEPSTQESGKPRIDQPSLPKDDTFKSPLRSLSIREKHKQFNFIWFEGKDWET